MTKDDGLLNGIIEGIVDGRKEIYNPVYFYGDESLVADALYRIASDYKRLHSSARCAWFSGDKYVHELLMAIKVGRSDKLRQLHRACDFLLFDHIEHIAGKQYTMKEFFELFDHIFIRGGRIVVAGNNAPGMIEGLEERVRTQLEGGIIYQIK